MFGFPKKDAERHHVPCECRFVNNLVVRTRPQPAPLVSLGLVRDLKADGNLGYSGEAPPHAEWARWFQWADPRLRRKEDGRGLWFLGDSSPAIDGAVDGSAAMKPMCSARPRVGRPDVGAEEFGPRRSSASR